MSMWTPLGLTKTLRYFESFENQLKGRGQYMTALGQITDLSITTDVVLTQALTDKPKPLPVVPKKKTNNQAEPDAAVAQLTNQLVVFTLKDKDSAPDCWLSGPLMALSAAFEKELLLIDNGVEEPEKTTSQIKAEKLAELKKIISSEASDEKEPLLEENVPKKKKKFFSLKKKPKEHTQPLTYGTSYMSGDKATVNGKKGTVLLMS